MIILDLKQPGGLMNLLLATESFDSYVVSEASITTFTTFTIDGSFHPDFFGPEDAKRLRENNRTRIYWKDVRSYCYQIIKGKHAPLAFHLVLMLSPRETARLVLASETTISMEQVHGLFLNINYNGSKLQMTTASSYGVFTMDRALDKAFDAYIRKNLDEKEIAYFEN